MACLSMKYVAISSLDWISAKGVPDFFPVTHTAAVRHSVKPPNALGKHKTNEILSPREGGSILFFFILRTSGTTAPSQYTCT